MPNFEALVKESPTYISAPDFAKTVILNQEINVLKKTYDSLDSTSNFFIFDDFQIKELSRMNGTFSFDSFDFNTHYTYDYDGQTYVVFIRNIDEYQQFSIRGKSLNYISAAFTSKGHIAAEITIRPVTVDKKPFILYDDKEASLILADIVDLKLIIYESGKVFYHEIAAEWKPKSRIDKIIKDLNLGNKL